jgi:hypothetical protein
MPSPQERRPDQPNNAEQKSEPGSLNQSTGPGVTANFDDSRYDLSSVEKRMIEYCAERYNNCRHDVTPDSTRSLLERLQQSEALSEELRAMLAGTTDPVYYFADVRVVPHVRERLIEEEGFTQEGFENLLACGLLVEVKNDMLEGASSPG